MQDVNKLYNVKLMVEGNGNFEVRRFNYKGQILCTHGAYL